MFCRQSTRWAHLVVVALATLQVVTGLIPLSNGSSRKQLGFSGRVSASSPVGFQTLFPSSHEQPTTTTRLNLASMDPADLFATAEAVSTVPSLLVSFTDQGQNLAGIFFQASLLPYLIFIYFLQFRGNRLNGLSNFGFQYVLLFVLATIPSGIISKAVYGQTLANTDWLHGGAELLLTVANILIVLGLKQAMTDPEQKPVGASRWAALGIAGLFGAACAVGPSLITDGHAPFLAGIGNLPESAIAGLATEPINALSIPTWAIHFSSVYEYLFAMGLVWQFAETTENEKWKGLTWGMLPLHASGICACTYHFFFNQFQYLVTAQAGLTALGNITCMIAAIRIALSNGWSISELNPFAKSAENPQRATADQLAVTPLDVSAVTMESNVVTGAKLVALTLGTSYLVKYGELAIDLPFQTETIVPTLMIIGIPAITAFSYYQKSQDSDAPAFSMEDVKKYGVAGTVAYVLTELAFWIVAFPVAATALYQSSGHWPDVMNDTGDRAAVLGFIFAGANIARALVPLRFGAALALAPWVDDNIINRNAKGTQ